MYASHELSQAVRTRRQEIGLSQQAVATLSRLSRSTVIDVEKGSIKDLSLTRTAALLDSLGLGLTISPAHPRPQSKASSATALELASRTASVSYARSVTPQILCEAFSGGEVVATFEPHVSTLLEEAPISLLAKVVEQVHEQSDIPRKQVWQYMRKLAGKFKTTREFWSVAS